MRKSYLALATAMLIFSACQKEKIATQADPSNTSKDLSQFYEDNFNDKVQTFIVDANSSISITGNQGSVLTIPANNFLDDHGQLVTGNIEIQFIEVFSKADMILLNKPTVTKRGETLLSDGEFYINVTLPGDDKTLKEINLMTLTVADETVVPNMKLWYDTGDGWELAVSDERSPDGVIEPYDAGYIAMVVSGWINFDIVYAFGPTMPIRVKVPPGSNPALTTVFMSIDGMATVVEVDASHFNGFDTYNCDAPQAPTMITMGAIQENAMGENTYNIIYSFTVNFPGQVVNLTTLLNGSIGQMNIDLNTLP